jgi:hypothetical protein
MNAPRSAPYEHDAQPPLEPPECLAHGRGAHPEAFADHPEVLRLGERGEHGHEVQIVGDHEVMLHGPCSAVK